MTLARPERAAIILGAIDFLRREESLKLLAFCIMPDHWHMLFVLTVQYNVSDLMKRIRRFSARELNRLLDRSGPFWQEGFHDHCCRDDRDIEEHLTYIELNPVRAGLIQAAIDWPFSSAHPANARLLDRQWYAEVH
ncbi:MAG TPA: transposase [Pirellulales bacterium]|jgi:REP element-mobilizing transposase RayT|nr:transposase [Pirellulales bacterium]